VVAIANADRAEQSATVGRHTDHDVSIRARTCDDDNRDHGSRADMVSDHHLRDRAVHEWETIMNRDQTLIVIVLLALWWMIPGPGEPPPYDFDPDEFGYE
jgi:hypothetical protein